MRLPAFNKSTAMVTAAAIADRGLLGVATLLTTILIGRWAGPAEFGLFAMFFPLTFIAMALQESLITAPYTIFAADCHSSDERAAYLGSVLVHSATLSLVMCAALAVAAPLLHLSGLEAYAALAAVLAPVVPCVLLREFARRVVYADLNPQTAVLISGGASALQLVFMAGLHFAGRLTAVTAFAAMGVSSLLGGGAWLIARRDAICFSRASHAAAFTRNWFLGRWIAAAQVGDVVRIHMFPWLLALALDEASVGVYAACAAIAALSNPLQVAISNVLLPQFAAVEARGGLAAADRLMWQATGWLTVAMLLFTLAMGSMSGQIVPLLYGADYAGSQTPLVLLLVAQLIVGVSLPAARALVALRRPELDFITHVLGIAINVAAGAPLVLAWGVTGAAAAALLGAGVKALLTAAFYSRELRSGRLGLGLPLEEGAGARLPEAAPSVPTGGSLSIGLPRGMQLAAGGPVHWQEELP